MSDIFDALPDDARQELLKREQLEWTDPMLATLTDANKDVHWVTPKLVGTRRTSPGRPPE